MIYILTEFSKTHTWLLPVFAVGLGAPRWCQMLWGTSSLALYIPWGGAAGPYLGTSLWLWLGVLDAIQGVGLGMILLQVCPVTVFHYTTPQHDFLLDPFTLTRLRYACVFSSHWVYLRHGCASYRSE
jgi:glycogen synthase